MFEIEYKGGNTVVITTKKAALVVDPKLSSVGGKDVVIKDAIELATESRLALNSPSAKLAIEGPGEYEVADFSVWGIAATRHMDTPDGEFLGTLYRLEIGDVRIALIGNIAGSLDENQLESLGVVDILVIPVGGGGITLDPTGAASMVRQIEPKLVIPVHYADEQLTYPIPQQEVEEFIRELRAPVEKVMKFKVKPSATIPEALTIIEIARS